MKNEDNHYVVILKWTADLESDVNILAVTHTEEEARGTFEERLVSERAFSEEQGFEIYTDKDLDFDAGLSGHYSEGHTHLYVQKV